MSNEYNYNRTGAERKALVEAVSQILGQPARYLGAPSFSYAVGDYTIDRCGVLSHGGSIHPDLTAVLIEDLRVRGFIAEASCMEDSPTGETVTDTAEPGTAAAENVADEVTETAAGNTGTAPPAAAGNSDAENTLTIEMPKTGFTDVSLDNLHKIIASREALIKKALKADSLPVIDAGDTLKFPWFTMQGIEGEADAYSRLVAAICRMAKERKRVTAKDCGTENDKFHMRLFLVQLGFIGDEYKTARKILLHNLSGNSSWKSGHAPVRAASNTRTDSTEMPRPEEPAGSMPQTETQPEVPEEAQEGGIYGK